MPAALLSRLELLEVEARSRLRPARPAARTPLAEWAARFVPAYFTDAPSAFHKWLVPELEGLQDARGSRLGVVAPRGAAKSTWISLAYPLWAAVEEREPYVLLLSDSGDQARKYLEAIRQELEDNPALAEGYPRACGVGPVWQQSRLRLRNGVLIEALGTGAKIRGRKSRAARPSLVITDDPQNNEHIVSPLQRQRSWSWFTREVLSVGDARTNYLVVGTALHPECIAVRLLDTPGWRARTFRSVIRWPDRMDLWARWQDVLADRGQPDPDGRARAFYEQHQADMEQGALVLWPEREPLYSLQLKLAEIGQAAFESEKQGNAVNPDACEWPAACFDHGAFWFDEWPEKLQVRTIGIDPSKGRDARHGDYSAVVLYGRDAAGVEYAEADLARRPVDAICAAAAAHAARFRPDGLLLEANAFQDLMAPPLRAALAAAGADVAVHLADNTAPKAVRIRRLTAPLTQRRMRFRSRSPGTRLLVQQLRDFPAGDHDDGPDALELARRLAIELANGRQQRRGQGPTRVST